MNRGIPTTAVLLVLLGAGCVAVPMYRGASPLRKHLEMMTTESTLDDVRAAAQRLPQADLALDAPLCRVCVEVVACEGDRCGIWMRSLHQQIVLVAREQDGRTSVRLARGGESLGSEALLAFWRALDPEVANRFDPDNPGTFGPAEPMP